MANDLSTHALKKEQDALEKGIDSIESKNSGKINVLPLNVFIENEMEQSLYTWTLSREGRRRSLEASNEGWK